MTHSMKVMVFAVIVMVSTTPLEAQDISGRWNGRMEPTNLSAEIELNFKQTGSALAVEMLFSAGPDGGSLPVEESRINGDSVFVRTRIEGVDIRLELVREDDLLLGSVIATENGRLFAQGPVGLARASDADGKTRLTDWLNALGDSIDESRKNAVIERATELLLSNYVFLDRAERAVADLRARVQNGEYEKSATLPRFAELLSRHLAEATGDRHVRVKYGAERVSDPLEAAVETHEELTRLRTEAEAEGFGLGEPVVLDGNVGYVEFKRFFRAELAGDAMAAVMHRLMDTDALIIDLRECHGGDPAMVALAASWLFDGRPIHLSDMNRRCDSTTTQYWTAAWLPGERYVDKNVYVLTSSQTFSAPESFAFELQQTKRATVVGETTGGGAHSGAWFPIDDRFSIFIPLSHYVSAVSGTDWEGKGIKPDVVVSAVDALNRAHELALDGLSRD